MIQFTAIEGRHYVRSTGYGKVYVYAHAGTYTALPILHGLPCDLSTADSVIVPLYAQVVGIVDDSETDQSDREALQDMIGTMITHEITLEAWLVRMAIENLSDFWREI